MAHLLLAEIQPRAVALVRIAVGLAAILQGILSYGSYTRLFQEHVVRARDLWFLPDLSPDVLPLFTAVWLGSAAGVTLGFSTRLSGGVLSAAIWYQLLVDQNLYSNSLYLLGIFSLLLTVADSGAAISLDARRRGPESRIPYWPVWLMKVQLSIMYVSTALAKALNDGWASGSVLHQELLLPWRFKHPELLQTIAALVIVIEIFLAAALWTPRWRKHAFLLGGFLHALMPPLLPAYTIALVVFQMTTLACYLLFLESEPALQTVIWDGKCPFCTLWVRWFRWLDWLKRYRFVGSRDEAGVTCGEADAGLQLLSGQRRLSGIDAVRGVMEGLPLSFLWAPVLETAPIRPLANGAYRRALQRCCRPVLREAVDDQWKGS